MLATLAFAVVAAWLGLGPAMFLVVAPLVPVAGVAMAYGPGIDPVHELTLASPVPAHRLLLLRVTAVLASTIVLVAIAGLALPGLGIAAVAWLLPALALSLVVLVLETVVPAAVAASAVTLTWFGGLLVAAAQRRGVGAERLVTEFVAFRPIGQAVATAVALGAGLVLASQRERMDVGGLR